MGENGWVTDHDEADRPAADQPQEPDDHRAHRALVGGSVARRPSVAPSWMPPVTQPPPGQWDAPYGAPQYGAIPPPQTRPYPSFGQPPPPPPPRGRVPGWIWPLVCVLALVLGLVGGAFGSLLRRAADRRHSRSGLRWARRRRHRHRGAAAGRQRLGRRGRRSSCSRARCRSPRSTKGRRAARPGPASCSTGRATSSRTTTSSRTPPRTTGRSRSSTRTATATRPRSSGAARSTTSPCCYAKDARNLRPARSAPRARSTSATRSSRSARRSA